MNLLRFIGLFTAVHWPSKTRHHKREEFESQLDYYRALAKWSATAPELWTYIEGHVEPFAGELGSFPERNTSRVPHENPETPGYVKTLRPVQCLVNDALTSARR